MNVAKSVSQKARRRPVPSVRRCSGAVTLRGQKATCIGVAVLIGCAESHAGSKWPPRIVFCRRTVNDPVSTPPAPLHGRATAAGIAARRLPWRRRPCPARTCLGAERATRLQRSRGAADQNGRQYLDHADQGTRRSRRPQSTRRSAAGPGAGPGPGGRGRVPAARICRSFLPDRRSRSSSASSVNSSRRRVR